MAEYFTLAEAETLLPRLEPLLRDVQTARQAFAEAQERYSAYQTKLTGNGHLPQDKVAQARQEMAEATQRADALISEIQTLGVVVKDLEMGLVDFPALRHGAEVYLCWRLGEQGIGWWHPVETGFAGRQPIETF